MALGKETDSKKTDGKKTVKELLEAFRETTALYYGGKTPDKNESKAIKTVGDTLTGEQREKSDHAEKATERNFKKYSAY